MSEQWSIAIFIALFGAIISLAVAATGFAFVIVQRVSRLETQFEDWIDRQGIRAADILHSPDDHLGIDYYLEQYKLHFHEMTMEQWISFRTELISSMAVSDATKLERAETKFLIELCDHKLECFQPKKKNIFL